MMRAGHDCAVVGSNVSPGAASGAWRPSPVMPSPRAATRMISVSRHSDARRRGMRDGQIVGDEGRAKAPRGLGVEPDAGLAGVERFQPGGKQRRDRARRAHRRCRRSTASRCVGARSRTRPSGAAMTVSAPLKTTIAPAARAAARARSILLPARPAEQRGELAGVRRQDRGRTAARQAHRGDSSSRCERVAVDDQRMIGGERRDRACAAASSLRPRPGPISTRADPVESASASSSNGLRTSACGGRRARRRAAAT